MIAVFTNQSYGKTIVIYTVVIAMRYTQTKITKIRKVFVCLMVFNATFNNISVISWKVLLVEETGEKHRPVTLFRISNQLEKIYGKPGFTSAKLVNLWIWTQLAMFHITWTYHEDQNNITRRWEASRTYGTIIQTSPTVYHSKWRRT